MTSSSAAIVPITLTVNDRTGLTLWAPPWEDEDGEEWQGFLGDGKKILLYPNVADLAAFIASGEENDLSDHPGWGQVLKATPDQLRPGAEDQYDLDMVYEWASGEPDPVHVSALADVVDMVGKIADCCDDGALRRLVEGTPAYAELVDEENTYQGKDGRKRWNELGDTIADSWERAIKRVDDWLEWVGDFTVAEFDGDDSIWQRVGAEPIELRFSDATLLTVRGDVAPDAEGDDTETVFLGEPDDNVVVFTEVADLARYCRDAKGHRLVKLEWWSELKDLDDDAFTPEASGRFDLRKPSERGADLVRELAIFCGLEADTDVLDGSSIDKDDWNTLVDEVRTCFDVQD
ncbi:MAG TPA: hypothetical protein VGN18_05305 [Jatrophihabitans sp.]|jgi:hypothetical protein|uniref:hypothetical protein n=1 Tax=Jatrophihabitans sp. TaxID=1932789 RepID=UPI002DF812C3|nr:hypothetical protein [Jatrophihabitans sp.]